MLKTPESLRLQIGFFGRRNVGKSSLLNALANQKISIVSDTPGTTTDPVKKAMELIPLGPVLFIDTAGLDDEGLLGAERVRRSETILNSVDAAVVVLTAKGLGEDVAALLSHLQKQKVATVVAVNLSDLAVLEESMQAELEAYGFPIVQTSALTGEGIAALRAAIVSTVPQRLIKDRPILSDLIDPEKVLILVTPIDAEAPKGRVIMPQVQALRDALDNHIVTMVVTEKELHRTLKLLKAPPGLVVTDSQAFEEVSAIIPESVPLTSFSIVFARFKGDLEQFAQGARLLSTLKASSKILIAEACSHNPVEGDIGQEKLPHWLREKIGEGLSFDFVKGQEFYDPEQLSKYDMVIHCGGCTLNRNGMLSRLNHAREAGVPMTNYGLSIAWAHGILERTLAPFGINQS